MPRIVKEPAVRRNEIIDAAQHLVYTKGYEQMTVQDILDALHISKGAFYHYFDSKGALLEALIERMKEEAEPVVLPIVDDPALPVIEKLQRFFDVSARWKTARKDYLLALLPVWYADENAIVRQKVEADLLKWAAPLLARIIRQGIDERIFTAPFPDQASEIVLSIVVNLGDAFAELLLSPETTMGDLQRVVSTVAAYNDALERLLGTPAGSLYLIDEAFLREWFPQPEQTPVSSSETLM
jgi:AcrR family transcriptional regulator